MVNYDKVPVDKMESSVKRYVETGTVHSDFLHAVLTDSLTDSFARADAENRAALNDWRLFIYNELPMDCWGDSETVKAWNGLGN